MTRPINYWCKTCGTENKDLQKQGLQHTWVLDSLRLGRIRKHFLRQLKRHILCQKLGGEDEEKPINENGWEKKLCRHSC